MREVIIPVLDEAQALPGVLGRMPSGYEAIVVDNGSSDGSGDVARRLGARVVHEPRKGFGAACFAGLSAATADVVCFMDGDGSLDPRELPRLAEPVAAGAADLVLGSRRPSSRGAWPPHARLANRVLALELRRRSGIATTDLGPMRAARREQLLGLGIVDRRFGWPLEMVLRAAAAGWRVTEVPVSYGPRDGGRSKVTGTVGGTAKAVRDMLRVLAEVDARVAREPLAVVAPRADAAPAPAVAVSPGADAAPAPAVAVSPREDAASAPAVAGPPGGDAAPAPAAPLVTTPAAVVPSRGRRA